MIDTERIEAAVIVGNSWATKYTPQSFKYIVSSVEIPHGEPILIDPGDKTDTWKGQLYQQINSSAHLGGDTAIIIVAGDGTVRSVVQAIDDYGFLEKYVFVHVPKGGLNINQNFYATMEPEVNTALKNGHIRNVDLMRVTMKGDFDRSCIALVDVGGNDAIPLQQMEVARKRRGKLLLGEKLLHVVRESKVMQPVGIRVTANGGVVYERSSFMAELVNGSLQLLGIEFAGGTPFDGELTATIIPAETRGEGTRKALVTAFNRAFHLQSSLSTAWSIMTKEVQVEFQPGVSAHVDAEFAADGVREIMANIQPGGARFLVPDRT
jgi:diacylglycerol kinase family enzyme